MREWNDKWADVCGEELIDTNKEGHIAYRDSFRRGIMASINWIEAHPGADLHYKMRNLRKLADQSGLPDNMPLDEIMFVGVWTDFYKPISDDTKDWFKTIDEAVCGDRGPEATPTFYMMRKSIACGEYVSVAGWDQFNTFMLVGPVEGNA